MNALCIPHPSTLCIQPLSEIPFTVFSLVFNIQWKDNGLFLPPSTQGELQRVNLRHLIHVNVIFHQVSYFLEGLLYISAVRQLDYYNVLYGINRFFFLEGCSLVDFETLILSLRWLGDKGRYLEQSINANWLHFNVSMKR